MLKHSSTSGFLDFVYDFYKGMKEHEITLVYEGEINHQIMKAFTSLAEGHMTKHAESELLQKKVYHVMVECLQNISKHASHPEVKDDTDYNRGIFLVSRNNDVYNITTGNIIKKEKILYLKELLGHINSLSKTDLNELYKKQLKEGHLSDKGGAGLGFIDIRRKTGKDLEYQFLPLSDSHSFFLFTSTIPRK
ncbi:MAG: hypothetical protein H6538_01135 [Bacteroidales bacterium]|nr:hypothetical protein [Bacteroidales bacterium]MCB8999845.1 hypothetical protein [Bacteroidales bacterium]MCB9012646.1 hypothetical protein [Bacteroidales bacterium]